MQALIEKSLRKSVGYGLICEDSIGQMKNNPIEVTRHDFLLK